MSSTGHLQRLGHRAHAVVDANVGVPQRVPQQFRDLPDDVGGHVVVQQHQIEVGVRQRTPPRPRPPVATIAKPLVA